jgi:hypothetical protein
MALSMDEQRMLAEIERRLAAEDPGLASCLTTFRRPGPARVLRSPRARIVGSLFTVLLVAMVSLMVYAMIPFRAHLARHSLTPATAGGYEMSVAGSQPPRTQLISASTGTSTKPSTKPSAANQTSKHPSSSATAHAHGTTADRGSVSAAPADNPSAANP